MSAATANNPSFQKRRLSVEFNLFSSGASGTFTDVSVPTKSVLNGLKISAQIIKAGSLSMGMCNFRIYGMELSLMNQLSTLGASVILTKRNSIVLSAGDDYNGISEVFAGEIQSAFVNFNGIPEVYFQVSSAAGLIQSVTSTPPISSSQPTDVATVMKGLADRMGLGFENNNVNVQLPPSYWPGTYKQQADAIAKAAHIEAFIDKRKLIIWPSDGNRKAKPIEVSPATGLIGYPSFVSYGVQCKVLYNPSLEFGQLIEIKNSGLTPADGQWNVIKMIYELDSETPSGQWHIVIDAAKPGVFPIVR